MNENIDLTKILKDCPEGTKLYSTIFGEVEFKKIEEESNYPIICITIAGNNCDVAADGRYYDVFGGECILFPSKEQRDWSKFTASWYKKEKDTIALLEKQGEQEESQVYKTEDHKIITYSETDGYKFVEPNFHEGDWVVNKFGDSWHIDSIDKRNYQVSDGKGNYNYFPISKQNEMHLWTIKDAKDGDVLVNGSNILIFHFINNRRLMGYCHVNMDDGNFYNYIGRIECFCTIDAPVTPATKEQRDLLFQKIKETGYKWNTETNTFEKLVEPKFKVGDRVRHKETNKDDVYEISKVYDDSYGIAGFTWMIYMKYQDQYELIPNKFDPKTLKPFDKVLVKISNESYNTWFADFVAEPAHVKNETPLILGAKEANMVIPYNDDTKHLIGTTDEAPEYYRYWED